MVHGWAGAHEDLAPIRKKSQSGIDLSHLFEIPWRETHVPPYRCPGAAAGLSLLRRPLGLSAGHSASAGYRIGVSSYCVAIFGVRPRSEKAAWSSNRLSRLGFCHTQ